MPLILSVSPSWESTLSAEQVWGSSDAAFGPDEAPPMPRPRGLRGAGAIRCHPRSVPRCAQLASSVLQVWSVIFLNHSAAALSPLSSSGDSFGVGLRHGFEDIFLQLRTFFFLEQSSWCAVLGGLFFLPDECVRARLQTGHLGPAWLINQSVRPVSKPRPFLVAQVPTASVTCDTGEGPSAGPAWTWAPSLSFLSCGECDRLENAHRLGGARAC